MIDTLNSNRTINKGGGSGNENKGKGDNQMRVFEKNQKLGARKEAFMQVSRKNLINDPKHPAGYMKSIKRCYLNQQIEIRMNTGYGGSIDV